MPKALFVAFGSLLLLAGCSAASTTIERSDEATQDQAAEPEAIAVEPTVEPTLQPAPTPVPTEEAAVEPPTSEPEPTVGQDPSVQGPNAAVQAAFDRYRQALVDLDAAAASQLVTPSTIDYYQQILDLGIAATVQDLLTTVSLSDSLGVLAMRARLGEELLAVPDGQALFDIGVERGLVGDSVGTTLLDQIEIDGGEAYGFVQGVKAFRFAEIDGEWRVDLPYTTALIDANETEFLQSVGGSGATREDLFGLVALGYQTTLDELGEPLG